MLEVGVYLYKEKRKEGSLMSDTEFMFSHLKNEQLIMKALALLLKDCDLRTELLRRTNGYSMASKNASEMLQQP